MILFYDFFENKGCLCVTIGISASRNRSGSSSCQLCRRVGPLAGLKWS